MATNYGDLKVQVATWLHRADLAASIPAFISGALSRVNLELAGYASGGLLDQESEAFAPLPIGQDALALPYDYRALRYIKIGSDTLDEVDYNRLLDAFGDNTGPPQKYAVLDGEFIFRPIPSVACTVSIGYFRNYPDFVADTDTNYLLTAAGNLMLYAACLEAAPFLANDPRVAVWSALYRSVMQRLHAADRQARRGPKRGVVLIDPILTRATRGYNINTDL